MRNAADAGHLTLGPVVVERMTISLEFSNIISSYHTGGKIIENFRRNQIDLKRQGEEGII